MVALTYVKGYEGLYSVDKAGNVFNHRTGGYMAQSSDSDGYKVVNLYNNGRRQFKVHRLVAETFLAGYSPKLTVNHKDQKRDNNALVNLEMMTMRENRRYSAHLSFVKAENIRHLAASGVSLMELSVLYAVTTSCIAKVVQNVSWAKP